MSLEEEKEEKKELKTLKDFEKVTYIEGEPFCGTDGDMVHAEELQQEAKKWVKHLRVILLEYDDLKYTYTYDEVRAKIRWINHFFNLEEE